MPVAASARQQAGSCPLVERCSNGGSEKLWGQSQVDSASMSAFVREAGLIDSSVRVPVAVIDSGFDLRGQGPAMLSPPRTAAAVDPVAGKPGVGNPSTDENGHGTFVSGLIAGAGGVGISSSADLTVYRVTATGSAGSTPDGWLVLALKKACREKKDPSGVAVINLSWGSWMDESGTQRDEDNQALMQELASQGCLVTKAAGNSSYKIKDATVNGSRLDDAYLRVAAIDPTSSLTYFSSNGEVAAPGFLVYSLFSQNTTKQPEADVICGKSRGGVVTGLFESGTSFAAPITAGVAAETVAVLKSRAGQRFAALSPAARVSLVNRILKASSVNGAINALRAVAIAARWQESAVPAVERLAALVDDAADLCGADAGSAPGCEGTRARFESLRRIAAFCPGKRASASRDLVGLALDADALETATHYFDWYSAIVGPADSKASELGDRIMRKYVMRWIAPGDRVSGGASEDYKKALEQRQKSGLKDNGNVIGDAVSSYLQSIESGEQKLGGAEISLIGRKMNYSIGLMSAPFVLRSAELHPDDTSRYRVQVLLSALLQNPVLLDTLRLDGRRGSNELATMLVSILERSMTVLGDKKVLEITQGFYDCFLRSIRGDELLSDGAAALVVPARLIAEMRARKGLQSIVPGLDALERKLWAELDRYNEFYGDKPDPGALRELPAVRPLFESLISRNQSSLKAVIEAGAFEKLAPVKMAWILAHAAELWPDPRRRSEIGVDVLGRISVSRGWGPRSDEEFMTLALKMIVPEHFSACEAVIEKSSNYDFISSLMMLRSALKTDIACLSAPQLKRLALRMAVSLIRRDPSREDRTLGREVIPFDRVVHVLDGFPMPEAILRPAVLPIAEIGSVQPAMSRLNWKARPADAMESLPQSGPVFDSLSNWAIQVYKLGSYELPDSEARTSKLGRFFIQSIVNADRSGHRISSEQLKVLLTFL